MVPSILNSIIACALSKALSLALISLMSEKKCNMGVLLARLIRGLRSLSDCVFDMLGVKKVSNVEKNNHPAFQGNKPTDVSSIDLHPLGRGRLNLFAIHIQNIRNISTKMPIVRSPTARIITTCLGVASVKPRLKRERKSKIGMISPRKLITPRINSGEFGNRVASVHPLISRTVMMSTPFSWRRALI